MPRNPFNRQRKISQYMRQWKRFDHPGHFYDWAYTLMISNMHFPTMMPLTSYSHRDHLVALPTQANQLIKWFIVQMRIGLMMYLFCWMLQPQLAAISIPRQDLKTFSPPRWRPDIAQIPSVHEACAPSDEVYPNTPICTSGIAARRVCVGSTGSHTGHMSVGEV